jgi:hypothetical protein
MKSDFEMEFFMLRFAFGLAACLGLVQSSDAGVFRKTRVVTAATVAVKGDTSTAQNAALLIVQTGRFRHNGHPAGLFEGIGMGSTQQGAIQNCCFWGRRNAVDIGTAQMSNGTWIAVVRYR